MIPTQIEFQEDSPCSRCGKVVRALYYATGVLLVESEVRRDKAGERIIVKHECEEDD